jgi:hypothetical protein
VVESINLGPEIEKASETFYDSHDRLVAKLDKRMANTNGNIQSSKGVTFNYFDVMNKVVGVNYKIRYVALSIDRLQKIREERSRAMEERIADLARLFAKQPPLPEDVLFYADITFSFLSSAMDIASFTVHRMHGTELDDRQVYLRKVCENLASKNGSEYDVFRTLRPQFENGGWIAKFEDYRNYATHHGRLRASPDIH